MVDQILISPSGERNQPRDGWILGLSHESTIKYMGVGYPTLVMDGRTDEWEIVRL